MKKKALLLLTCLCSLNAFSQDNYFTEGTSWIIQTDYIDHKGQSQTCGTEQWIDGTTRINGRTSLNLWEQDYDLSKNERIGSDEDKSLCSFFYAEGKKVYTFSYRRCRS